MFFCQFLLGTNIQYTSPINFWFPSPLSLNQVGNQLQLFSIQTKCISLNVDEEITINSDEQIAWNQVYLWKMIDRENCKKKCKNKFAWWRKWWCWDPEKIAQNQVRPRRQPSAGFPNCCLAMSSFTASIALAGFDEKLGFIGNTYYEQLCGQHCSGWL